jgi:hypothetical protein
VLIALGSLIGRAILPVDADAGYDYTALVRGFVRDADAPPKGVSFDRRMFGVVNEARQTPGVVGAAFREQHFAFPSAIATDAEGQPVTAEDGGLSLVWIQRVADGFFGVLRPRLVAGRFPTDDEITSAAPLAVVSKSLASALFDGSPINKTLQIDGSGLPRFVVVGVVEDVREHPYDTRPAGTLFVPLTPTRLKVGMSMGRELWIRTATPGPVALRSLRSHLAPSRLAGFEVSELDAMTNVMRREKEASREIVRMLGAIFVVAIVLAAFGIYGLGAYTAEMRSREFAIREALGATRVQIATRVLGSAVMQAAAGLGAGALLSTMIIEHLNGYQLRLTTALGATCVASVVIGVTVLIASIGPVASAWRRNLAVELKA